MAKIDKAFLVEIGLDKMPDDQLELFLDYLKETLETRVGARLAQNVDEESLQKFEKLIDDKDANAAYSWLEENCPNYRQVVEEETEKICQEIISKKDQILSAN